MLNFNNQNYVRVEIDFTMIEKQYAYHIYTESFSLRTVQSSNKMFALKKSFDRTWSIVQKVSYTISGKLVRALALKNANAIFKPFLTFYDSKCAASKDAKHTNCKKFYNSATVQFNL